jgi:5-methylcytosine-specific restriction endonuclease McrA
MSLFNNKKVLILNKNYRPISYYPLSVQSMRRALKGIVTDKLEVVEEYDDIITIGNSTMKLPKTVVLKRFVEPLQVPKFSRYNVYLRDKFTCQYCGKKFSQHDLTFDHLSPKSNGGPTNWTNIITACRECNCKKGCHDAKGKFEPLSLPHIPTNKELMRNLKELKLDIGSQLKTWENWLDNLF